MEVLGRILGWVCMAVVAGAFGSAFLLVFGKKCTRRQGIVSATLICSYLALVIVCEALRPKIEWSPSNLTADEVLGTWSDGKETLVLNADGTYRSSTPAGSSKGTWRRDGSTLCFDFKSIEECMWFVRCEDRCLLTHPIDPDDWSPTSAFTRIEMPESASATVMPHK